MRRVRMHQGSSEFGHRVSERMLGAVCNRMSFGKCCPGIDVEFCIGMQSVSDPPHLQITNTEDSRFVHQCMLCVVHQLRFDAVHQPPEDVSRCSPEHRHDGNGDDKADDRICQRETQRNSPRPQKDCERSESVGPSMQSISHQGR